MSRILCIETATPVCSVAVVNDGEVISLIEDKEGNRHASLLTTLIAQAIETANLKMNDLEAIAVSIGPGSYTGLRVGVSTAKGLCYGLGKPLIAVNTLHSMAAQFLSIHPDYKGLLVPMLDARRMEVYEAVFDAKLQMIHPTNAHIIHSDSFQELLSRSTVTFFGSGAGKCMTVISSPNAKMVDSFDCSATGMAVIANEKWMNKQFEDVAYLEPFYLKDFVGTTPKRA